MKKEYKKIILVKNKTGSYPSHWTPLYTDEKRYWLGGDSSVWIPIFNNPKQVEKAGYELKRQMKSHNLQYMSRRVK